jgi:predicted metal-dependent phosphoesterase TrpH
MKLYANLHLHSTHSDGVDTPTKLAQLVYEEGYKAAALTDHDSVSGNAEFMAACRALGM